MSNGTYVEGNNNLGPLPDQYYTDPNLRGQVPVSDSVLPYVPVMALGAGAVCGVLYGAGWVVVKVVGSLVGLAF